MLHHLMPLICSPWLYVVVFVAVAIDGFFPVMPSETLVIGLFALSATGSPNVLALGATVAAGGLAGDQISYRLGRRASRFALGRMAGTRAKAERALRTYGGTAILVGRFIPYGRTATTVTAGSVSMAPGRFRLFTALAGVAWAVYAFGLGRIGGATFTDRPLLGAGFGMALGMLLATVCAFVEKRRVSPEPSRPRTPWRQPATAAGEPCATPCALRMDCVGATGSPI
ncbi:DedA family protein [Actinoplanes sp. HUAS TT8]|uniref:DedA family protein n=1 Tax=Actinoplanes sp. HUAS TT8 TaxID=3447453 RepID=UPI003F523148